MTVHAAVVIVADVIAAVFAVAALINLMDLRGFQPTMKPEDTQYGIFQMIQACAELLMAFFIAAAGAALAGVIVK